MLPNDLLICLTFCGVLIRSAVSGSLPEIIPPKSCPHFPLCKCWGKQRETLNPELPRVDCWKLNLTHIPEVLDPDMATLNFSFNSVTFFSLPDHYPKLQNLNISHNEVMKLDFRNCKGLKMLDLSWNNIKALDEVVFRNLPFLRQLSLAHNRLTVLHANIFSSLLALKNLDLSSNYLTDVGCLQGIRSNATNLDLLPGLEMVNLAHNKLAAEDYCIGLNLPNLTHLDVSGSLTLNLTCLLDLASFPNLHHLAAKSCSISQLSLDDIVESPLTGLDLSGNKMVRVDYGLDMTTPHKVERLRNMWINLQENHLICDCHFYRLYSALEEQMDAIIPGFPCLSSTTRSSDLASLQSRCYPPPAYFFPLVISLLGIFLLLAIIIVIAIYIRQKRSQKRDFQSAHWKIRRLARDDYNQRTQSCASESTNCTNPSPDLNLTLTRDISSDEEKDVEEHIYATIEEFYVNREFIEHSEKMPVTHL